MKGADCASTAMSLSSTYDEEWHKLVPNHGADSEGQGVSLPLHRDVRSSAWEIVEHPSDSVTLHLSSRLPLILERTAKVQGPAPMVEEDLRGDIPADVPFAWIYHLASAAPSGTKNDLPHASIRSDPGLFGPQVGVPAGRSGRQQEIQGTNVNIIDLSVVSDSPVEQPVRAKDLASHRRHPDDKTVAIAWDPDTSQHVVVVGDGRFVLPLARPIGFGRHRALNSIGLFRSCRCALVNLDHDDSPRGTNRAANVARNGRVSTKGERQ